jgi:hypothetical protein
VIFLAATLSVALHAVVLLAPLSGGHRSSGNQGLNIIIAATRAGPDSEQWKPPGKSSGTPSSGKDSPAQNESNEHLFPRPPLVIAHGSDELDEPLSVESGNEIELPDSISDQISGRAEISLLIGHDGFVRWIGVASTDLSNEDLQPIIDQFRTKQFTRPTIAGLPTNVIIRVEIKIGISD